MFSDFMWGTDYRFVVEMDKLINSLWYNFQLLFERDKNLNTFLIGFTKS